MPNTPLAVYIHWPFCKAKCPYCDFNSHVREGVDQPRWKAALLRELKTMAGRLPGRTVTSIFFGGGTPSLMPADTARALIEQVGTHWNMDSDVEITLEANPTSVEITTFPAFARAGINRVSLGIQSLRSEALSFLGREHSTAEALLALERARETFRRYSFDLIYARPGQTLSGWEAELKEALSYAGRHVSLYQLTIEENTAFWHDYKKGKFVLPSEEEAEAFYRLTEEMTAARGLMAYEVSNYSVPGEESAHNLTYWRGGDYVGIGPGAHGRLTLDKRIATQTIKSPERWLEKVERDGHGLELWEEVPEKQGIEERVMMGMRLVDGIDYREFREQTGVELADHINTRNRALYIREGLLVDDPARLQATFRGRLLLNRLTAELL